MLLALLGGELLNAVTLESVYVLCSLAAVEQEYLDCLVNACFRQLTRAPAAAFKPRVALLAAFLLQLSRAGLYRFRARLETWRGRYPDALAQLPAALTEG